MFEIFTTGVKMRMDRNFYLIGLRVEKTRTLTTILKDALVDQEKEVLGFESWTGTKDVSLLLIEKEEMYLRCFKNYLKFCDGGMFLQEL